MDLTQQQCRRVCSTRDTARFCKQILAGPILRMFKMSACSGKCLGSWPLCSLWHSAIFHILGHNECEAALRWTLMEGICERVNAQDQDQTGYISLQHMML